MTEPKVTQADQDAAEEWRLDMDPGMRSLLAAAFARHRVEATTQERAKIVAWLRDTIFNCTLADIPSAIEAKEHLK